MSVSVSVCPFVPVPRCYFGIYSHVFSLIGFEFCVASSKNLSNALLSSESVLFLGVRDNLMGMLNSANTHYI